MHSVTLTVDKTVPCHVRVIIETMTRFDKTMATCTTSSLSSSHSSLSTATKSQVADVRAVESMAEGHVDHLQHHHFRITNYFPAQHSPLAFFCHT